MLRSISPETRAPDTQKNELKPMEEERAACIPRVSGEFVAPDGGGAGPCTTKSTTQERPVVCFDETSRQLTGDVRPPIKAAPGRVDRYDTEYQRNGTRNLFMIW